VTPPFERLDLIPPSGGPEDLIEEVGRIIGYDRIEAAELPALALQPAINANFYWQEKVREFLVERGFSEVFTSVFSETGDRTVLNKVDGGRPHLRTNLSDGLRDALERNVRIKDILGVVQVRLFEIGTIWHDGIEEVTVDIAVENAKGQQREDELRAELAAFIASIKMDVAAYETLPGTHTTRYQPFSRYPFIVRDISMWIEDSDAARGTVLSIFATASQGLLRHVNLFDQFKKDGKTSLGFRLVFQSFEQTLTDAEVNGIMRDIQKAIEERGWEVR
jgi:phenylalanyl-tRNA synthetase beta subunit